MRHSVEAPLHGAYPERESPSRQDAVSIGGTPDRERERGRLIGR